MIVVRCVVGFFAAYFVTPWAIIYAQHPAPVPLSDDTFSQFKRDVAGLAGWVVALITMPELMCWALTDKDSASDLSIPFSPNGFTRLVFASMLGCCCAASIFAFWRFTNPLLDYNVRTVICFIVSEIIACLWALAAVVIAHPRYSRPATGQIT